jgi:hypothetical protein
MPVVLNFILFQAGWFALVIGAAQGFAWAGALAAGVIVAAHLVRAARPRAEATLLLLAGLIGVVFDTALAASGAIVLAAGAWIPGLAPYWMAALWLNFATTLNVSLAWLKSRLLLAVAAGAIGGPLAYYGGEKLGALELASPAPALAALAIGWGIITPLLLVLARRFDGYGREAGASVRPETSHA